MLLDIHAGNLTTKHQQNILCSIMQQRFCHIYTYNNYYYYYYYYYYLQSDRHPVAGVILHII